MATTDPHQEFAGGGLTDPEKRRAYFREYGQKNRVKKIAAAKAWREANREKRLKYEAEYRKANPERRRATEAKYRERNRDAITARRHSIDVRDYVATKEKQGLKCEICHKTPKRLCVDHDHENGRFRGLLCSKCNSAIGLLGEDTRAIERALWYLLSHHRFRRATA
jgi:hypothetical protein